MNIISNVARMEHSGIQGELTFPDSVSLIRAALLFDRSLLALPNNILNKLTKNY